MGIDNFNNLTPAPLPGYRNVTVQATAPPTDPTQARLWSFCLPDPVADGALLGVIEIAIAPTSPGLFQVPHGLGVAPTLVLLQETSGGEIWFAPDSFGVLYDDTYIYLEASAGGVTCIASLWMTGPTVQLPLAPTSPGSFSVAHGLGAKPALVLIQMTSGAEIWLSPGGSWSELYDDTNIYLEASAGGITGNAIVFLAMPNPVIVESVTLDLAPTSPGLFQVAHGLNGTPTLVLVQMTSSGEIWLQSPLSYDDRYVYFEASAGGITATVQVWASGTSGTNSGAPTTEVPFTSSAGNFTIAHGLGYKPDAAIISMTSLGTVVFQAALRWDATNFYLQGSAAGLTGYVEVWK